MVVWHDFRNAATTGNDVFGQRVSAGGKVLGRNIPIATDPDSQSDPSIAHNRIDNSYLVAWQQQPFDKTRPDFNDAFGQILSSDGDLGNAFAISDAGLEISTAFNSRSDSYLVTGRAYRSGAAPGVWGRLVSHDGAPLGNATAIDIASNPAPNGQVIYNPKANEYFAAWRDQTEENLKGQRISAGGALIGKPIVISSVFPEAFGGAASLAFDPVNNRYLVVFVPFQGTKIIGQFISSSGNRVGAAFPIGRLDSRETPSVAYSKGDRAYVIVWNNDDDIVARLLSESGRVVGNTLPVTDNDKAAGRPRIVQNLKSGEFLVVWPDETNLSKGRRDICAQLVAIQN